MTPVVRITKPLRKPAPLTVSVKPGPPAVALDGDRLVTDELTIKLTAVEIPPPGAGLNTVMGNVPNAAMSAAGICAVNCVALTSAVVRAPPLKRTRELPLKFVPVTVSVNAAVPANLLVGDKVLSVGAGLLTVKVSAGVDVPPPGVGFVTVTEIVPAVAISDDAI